MAEIFPGTVRRGLVSQNREAQDIAAGIQSLRAAIRAYINETGLKGAAFAAHKAYMTEAHMDFLNMYARALSSMTAANERHIAAINTHLSTHSWFNSAQIEGEIACLTIRITVLDSLMSLLPASGRWMENTHDNLVNLRTDRQQKLQRLWDYISATNGIYIAPDRVLTETALLLSRIELTERCKITGMVTMPSMDDVKAAMAAMAELKNDDGSHNWDLIRKWMHMDPGSLTQAQLTALAQTFMGLTCVIDIERFINAGHIIAGKRRRNLTFTQTPVFSIVSDTVQKLLRPRIADIEASDNPFSTRAERFLFLKYYELQNDGNRRVMDGFLSPIRTASMASDILEIKFISYRAPELYKEIMFRHLPGIGIMNNDGSGRSQHFSSSENAIVVNFSDLRHDNDYLTFFHEIGHAVDFAMGARNTYASAALFDTLEAEVFGAIRDSIRAHTDNPADIEAIFNVLRYDGGGADLECEHRDFYDEVVAKYVELFNTGKDYNPQNRTASMIFGGFTDISIRTNPETGEPVGRGHGIYHPFAVDEYGNSRRMWYDPATGPTGAQNREFFADVFAANVIQDTELVATNNGFFGNTIGEMERLIQDELRSGGR